MGIVMIGLIAASILFIIGMFSYGMYQRYWKGIGPASNTVTVITDNDQVQRDVPDKDVNAFIKTLTDIIPARLPDTLLMQLHNGWFRFNGNACVICQENPKSGQLEKWDIQNHSITEDKKAYNCRTPQELYEMMLWNDEVEAVYKNYADNLTRINQALMVIVLISFSLLSLLMLTGD